MKIKNEDKILKIRKVITCIIVSILICIIAYIQLSTQTITSTKILMYLFGIMIADTLIVWIYDICEQN